MVPRVNLRGSIPYGHALLRLAAATPGSRSFEETKDQALSLFRKCKNMGNWTFNLTDPGNRCQRAADMLNALDEVWAGYVNGSETRCVQLWRQVCFTTPRKVPFDGVVPNDRSNYPTSNGLAYERTIDMANHLDIYRRREALDRTADGMLLMQMERVP